MKLEDIKNMSDEEFIELVKKTIKEEKEAKEDLPDNVIRVSPEKFKCIEKLNNLCDYLLGATVGGIIGVCGGQIALDCGAYTNNAKTIALITCASFVVLSMPLVYFYKKSEKKKDAEYVEHRKIEIETELKNNILNLKKLLENLTDEDFELLARNIKVLEENQINNEIIRSSNVLLAANQLIELNATDILNEFETAQDQNKYNENYSDDAIDMGYSKNMKESN